MAGEQTEDGRRWVDRWVDRDEAEAELARVRDERDEARKQSDWTVQRAKAAWAELRRCSARLETLKYLAKLCIDDRDKMNAGFITYVGEYEDVIESRARVAGRALIDERAERDELRAHRAVLAEDLLQEQRQTEPHQAVRSLTEIWQEDGAEAAWRARCLQAEDELARVRAERDEARAVAEKFAEALRRIGEANPHIQAGKPNPLRQRAENQAAEIVALIRSYANVHMTQALADLIEHKYGGAGT